MGNRWDSKRKKKDYIFITYPQTLQSYFKDMKGDLGTKSHSLLVTSIDTRLYENTIAINGQKYIKFPDEKASDEDECSKCQVRRKIHRTPSTQMDPFFQEFTILGELIISSSLEQHCNARRIYLAYHKQPLSFWGAEKPGQEFVFIEFYVNNEFEAEQENKSNFGGAELTFAEKLKDIIPLKTFLDNLGIKYNLEHYYGNDIPQTRMENKLNLLKIKRLLHDEESPIEKLNQGFMKYIKPRLISRSNLPSRDGPYPRSNIIQVSLNDIEIGHNFQGKPKKPKHTLYKIKDRNEKTNKHCYLILPPMKLGVCNGKDGDEICKNFTPKNLPSKHDKTLAIKLEDGLKEIKDIMDDYTDFTKFEKAMDPLKLINWLNKSENWELLKKQDRFGSIDFEVEKEKEDKDLLLKHILYYYTIYTNYTSKLKIAQENEQLRWEDIEKARVKMKSWVLMFGQCSKWEKINSPLRGDKPKITNPEISILLCNLFFTIVEEIVHPEKSLRS